MRPSVIDIGLGLKLLLASIDRQPSFSKEDQSKLKMLVIDSKMNRSKYFKVEHFGLDVLYESFERVLNELRLFVPYSIPFSTRVNRKETPDYYEVIKIPMDFGTMSKKIRDFAYASKQEFISDLNLIRSNCYEYNQDKDCMLRVYADNLQRKWVSLVETIPDVALKTRQELSTLLAYNFNADFCPNENEKAATPQAEPQDHYGKYLSVRASRCSLASFADQPAIIRTGQKFAFPKREDDETDWAESFPSSTCLARPARLYIPHQHTNTKAGDLSQAYSTIELHKRIRRTKLCIDQVHRLACTNSQLQPSGFAGSQNPISEMIAYSAGPFGEPLNKPPLACSIYGGCQIEYKHDAMRLLQRLSALIALEKGIFQTHHSFLCLLSEFVYSRIFSFCLTISRLLAKAPASRPIVLTALAKHQLSPQMLIRFLRNQTEKRHNQLQKKLHHLESKLERLIEVSLLLVLQRRCIQAPRRRTLRLRSVH